MKSCPSTIYCNLCSNTCRHQDVYVAHISSAFYSADRTLALGGIQFIWVICQFLQPGALTEKVSSVGIDYGVVSNDKPQSRESVIPGGILERAVSADLGMVNVWIMESVFGDVINDWSIQWCTQYNTQYRLFIIWCTLINMMVYDDCPIQWGTLSTQYNGVYWLLNEMMFTE